VPRQNPGSWNLRHFSIGVRVKLINVSQWMTDRGHSGGSSTRPKPAGGSVANPACVWGNPGCGARGMRGGRLSIEPRNLYDRGPQDKPDASAEGESRRGAERGRQQSPAASGGAAGIPPGSENTACFYRGDLGTREIQHLPQTSRSKGSRVISVPGPATRRPPAPAGSEERGGREVPKGEVTSRSPRDGMLEVLTEHSTDGRSAGRTLAVREGGEVRHKRPAVGKVKSDPATGGVKHARDLSSQSMSTQGHQTVWTARPSGRPGRCSRCWVPVASAEALARTWFLPRNRMSELFTYGSVGRAPGNRCLYPDRQKRPARECPALHPFPQRHLWRPHP